MNIITTNTIKEDILTTRFGEFVNAFPDMLGLFKTLKDKPKCEACSSKLFAEFNNKEDLEEKLKKLYGSDCVIDEEILKYKKKAKTPNISPSETEVFSIAKEDYATFMAKFTKDKIIRVIATTYIPEDNEILATIVYNSVLRPL